MKETVIISLGGSLIVPDEIDVRFLNDFVNEINRMSDRFRFVVYCGGGSTARKYQKAAGALDDYALDEIGIKATSLNALLVRNLFGDRAEKHIIEDPTAELTLKKDVIVASGWKPGWSTDYDAVLLAKNIGVRRIINMSNVDYVYSADPKEDKSARPLEEMSWAELRSMIGDEWKPGMNAPFDPVAAREAEENRIEVAIIGKDIANLRKSVENKDFKGTRIS